MFVSGDGAAGAFAAHSAGRAGAAAGVTRRPAGETPPAAARTNTKVSAGTRAQGEMGYTQVCSTASTYLTAIFIYLFTWMFESLNVFTQESELRDLADRLELREKELMSQEAVLQTKVLLF